MSATALYPLQFEPLYQYRLWGGRRLGSFLFARLPGDEPIGEAWLLSDRDDPTSRVAEGPLKGKTIAELAQQSPDELLGVFAGRLKRFPLLLKLLDVKQRQLAFLRDHDCPEGQGYYFSRPVAADEFAALLSRPFAVGPALVSETPLSGLAP